MVIDRRRILLALGLSIVIHSYLARTIANIPPPIPRQHGGKGDKDEGSDADGLGGTNKIKIKIKIGPIRGEDGEIIEMNPVGKNGEPCYEYFGGIGIYQDGFGNVTDVIPHYPASRLGLKAGDHIVHIEDIVGEIGSTITFSYIRNGVIDTVTVKREKICTRHFR